MKSETKYQLADQTKSENFKKWFGDWEKDPKNASKVVNEKGEPLVVYHGTDSKFYIFEQMDAGGGFPEASYFSSNKLVSDTY
ncbi:MAG: hypothetical protein Q4B28_05225 [bacterium]|nr:hypothetical protein [bacterium]